MKYYLLAGEASGDLHGSNLIYAIKQSDPQADIRAWGGDMMEAAGAKIEKHYRELAFMGFVEVIQHLGTILGNIKKCKVDIEEFQPDVIVFIDYPGFNMRIAKWAHLNGFKTAYYISPTVWAWKENRVHHIHKYVDEMMVILPFEKPFYAKYEYPVHYVGHPLVEVLEKEKLKPSSLEELKGSSKILALLPGSRTQEIKKLLPLMLDVASELDNYKVVIAQAPGQEAKLYEEIIGENKTVYLVKGKTYDLLKIADAAIVTSGTATLETALFEVPQVVVYVTNSVTYAIAKRLVKTKYISLVNLILDKFSVVELIQDEYSKPALTKALFEITNNEKFIQQQKSDYKLLWQMLAKDNKASINVAEIVFELAKKK